MNSSDLGNSNQQYNVPARYRAVPMNQPVTPWLPHPKLQTKQPGINSLDPTQLDVARNGTDTHSSTTPGSYVDVSPSSPQSSPQSQKYLDVQHKGQAANQPYEWNAYSPQATDLRQDHPSISDTTIDSRANHYMAGREDSALQENSWNRRGGLSMPSGSLSELGADGRSYKRPDKGMDPGNFSLM